jgi:hypothetical protein
MIFIFLLFIQNSTSILFVFYKVLYLILKLYLKTLRNNCRLRNLEIQLPQSLGKSKDINTFDW